MHISMSIEAFKVTSNTMKPELTTVRNPLILSSTNWQEDHI
jgi:hypothetical protein